MKAKINELLAASPALWMWFFDPHTILRTERISTFANGVSIDSLRVFAANYAAHFRWSYLVTTGDPQTGTTWRYLNGFGAFFWWVVPLAALGLAFTRRYVREWWGAAWVWLWLAVYPLGGALTNEGAPNAPRTLAGAPVFCLLAALGFAVLLDASASLRWKRAVSVVLATATTLSAALFAQFYFTKYVHLNSNAWDSGTRAMFGAVRAQREYDRACFSVRPAWYGIDAYTRFYLGEARMQIIDGVRDPRCALPGTLLITDTDHTVARKGFTPVATILDVDGNKFAAITGSPRPGAANLRRRFVQAHR